MKLRTTTMISILILTFCTVSTCFSPYTCLANTCSTFTHAYSTSTDSQCTDTLSADSLCAYPLRAATTHPLNQAQIWDGSISTEWYDAEEEGFSISTPEELAGLASLANKGNDFSGKEISLVEDIRLNPFDFSIVAGSEGVTNSKVDYVRYGSTNLYIGTGDDGDNADGGKGSPNDTNCELGTFYYIDPTDKTEYKKYTKASTPTGMTDGYFYYISETNEIKTIDFYTESPTSPAFSILCWTPVCWAETTTFSGNLNGNAHQISGLFILQDTLDLQQTSYTGLFGNTTFAEIKACTLNGCVINRSTQNSSTATLCGLNSSSSLTDCSVDSIVLTNANTRNYCGLLVGTNRSSGQINSCSADGYAYAVGGTWTIASGLIGNNESGTVSLCTSAGTIHSSLGSWGFAGGIVGENNESGTISECVNTSEIFVSGKSYSYSGGITGNNSGLVKSSTNEGNIVSHNTTVTASNIAGGIVGNNGSTGNSVGRIRYCNNSGSVTALYGGVGNSGGIAGNNDGGLVNTSTNTGSISTKDSNNCYSGGIIGSSSAGTVTSTQNNGHVTCDGDIATSAGIIGYNNGALKDSQNTAQITVVNSKDCYAAGVVANNKGNVYNSFTIGKICLGAQNVQSTPSASEFFVAGLCANNSGTLENCYSASEYEALNDYSDNLYTAGLVAKHEAGGINNCYWMDSDELPACLMNLAGSTLNKCGKFAPIDENAALTVEAVNAGALATSSDKLTDLLDYWVYVENTYNSASYAKWYSAPASVNGGYPQRSHYCTFNIRISLDNVSTNISEKFANGDVKKVEGLCLSSDGKTYTELVSASKTQSGAPAADTNGLYSQTVMEGTYGIYIKCVMSDNSTKYQLIAHPTAKNVLVDSDEDIELKFYSLQYNLQCTGVTSEVASVLGLGISSENLYNDADLSSGGIIAEGASVRLTAGPIPDSPYVLSYSWKQSVRGDVTSFDNNTNLLTISSIVAPTNIECIVNVVDSSLASPPTQDPSASATPSLGGDSPPDTTATPKKDKKSISPSATPARVKGVKLANKRVSQIKVTWKTTRNAKSYRVWYSTTKKFVKKKTKKINIKKKSGILKTTTQIKKLKQKRMYYVRVKGVNGKLLSKKYSVLKKLKVKK